MSNIIGPINKKNWFDMSQLLNSVKFLSSKDPLRYKDSIDIFSNAYNELKAKYATNH